MQKKMFKTKFLVKEYESVKKYLHDNSLSFKLYKYVEKNSLVYDFKNFTYVLEKYKKPFLNLSILVLICDKKIKPFDLSLTDITNDKRYKREYLKLFGNPTKYDFNPKDVFKRCDSVGMAHLELHFMAGMSSLKVFRVLLYRLNQIFSLHYQSFLDKHINFDILQDSHKRLKTILKFSKGIFDKKIVLILEKEIDDLYALLNSEFLMDSYLLNFEFFIQEDSHFFSAKNKEIPIYFLIHKRLVKNINKSKEKKSILYHQNMLSREFVTNIDKISYIREYFSSIFTKEELTNLNLTIQSLKKPNNVNFL